MRQAVTGWIIAAGLFVLLGVGAMVGSLGVRGGGVPDTTVARWREYATLVEQGQRTPLPATTRMLTETAIAQNTYAASATRLLRFVGAGVAVVGLILLLDLVRYRARLARGT